jgi:microcystin-dependent protein
MSNYSKTTDFAAKDALTTGNANKIVKGTEIDDEFEAIQTAVNSKADTNNSALTGTPTAPTADAATNNTQIATTAFVATTFAAKASPALTGTPTAPTADVATDTTQIATTAFVKAAAALLYPVGSIYSNAAVATNPGTLLGFGTWTAFGAGRVMVGLDAGGDADFDTVEQTGGAKTHTLTISEMPAHTHTYVEDYSTGAKGPNDNGNIKDGTRSKDTGSTGGGTAHNNLQPYIVVYMWKRTA